jgi:hypothetical protein
VRLHRAQPRVTLVTRPLVTVKFTRFSMYSSV